MESKNAVIAIILSVIILIGYQQLIGPPPEPPQETQQTSPEITQPAEQPVNAAPLQEITSLPEEQSPAAAPELIAPENGREISVTTSLYEALISETGGTIKSFKLHDYRESIEAEADFKELIKTENALDLPLFFSWGTKPQHTPMTTYSADQQQIIVEGDQKTITMSSSLPTGIDIIKTLTFSDNDYRIEMTAKVINRSQNRLQGAPYLSLTNRPFSPATASKWLFTGPALLHNNELKEIKLDDLAEAEQTFSGEISWLAYEDTYFMTALVPKQNGESSGQEVSANISVSDADKVKTLITAAQDIISPQQSISYSYTLYFGPKKLETLQSAGSELDRIVNFGWWDFLAKPTLYLLNILNGYVNNYGIAIILVTVIIKLLFWPIAQKGMKSMKNMQKLKPKMDKLREKYKDDKERLNQEMVQLYKTYKINPVGGCLPMVLQIPVFFALYKVLLQTIELRHAPFMLWITDLSAPDRLFIGFDIPYLGGIPVLTLLMGGSMFLQQKMTPTAADPTQAKIMMFLPVVFTFMFLNFASGLVLYWFVNNLLSIAQQYFINRQVDA